MKIAFVSYEYPPDTALGGIATYVYQLSKLLKQRGHHIEVFSGSSYRQGTEIEDGIVVHRVQDKDKNRKNFSLNVGRVFAERHTVVKFDVLEGAEIYAYARGAVQLVPDIPLVVKLHTPSFLIGQINRVQPSLQMKVRRYVGALRRGNKPQPFPRRHYDIKNDIERLHTLDADEITTPSKALGDKLIEAWELPTEKVVHIPNPYIPSEELLNLPVKSNTNVVTFMGRLEVRKGVLDLAQAIPLILQQYPDTRFRFVGRSLPLPLSNLDMQQHIEKTLQQYRNSLEFTGAVRLNCISSILADTDICVFPSIWENFPNVCLESMAAARGVVGSNAGGMMEMLNFGRTGRLVPPRSPEKIAEAVIELLENPELRMQLGQAARERVLTEYNLERIGALQEASYVRAIERRQALGARESKDSVSEGIA